MTTPKSLSPAAQAIKDAVLATYSTDCIKEKIELWNIDERQVIAALRAVAKFMEYSPDHIELHRIATELEGANA